MFGELNHTTGHYSGAIGDVQHQKADFLSSTVYYPLMDPNQEYFNYSFVNIEDVMMIASAYKFSQKFDSKDVIDALTGFPPPFFWTLFATFTALFLFFKIGLWTSNRIKSDCHRGNSWERRSEKRCPGWLITRAFLMDDNFNGHDLFQKSIATTTCLFVFLFSSYMLSGMSTDMVVVKDPVTIGSYQDILDRDNVQIIWPTFIPDFQTFRDAPSDSIESKLWPRRQMIRPEDSAMTTALKMGERIVDQSLVLVLREPLVRFAAVMACSVAHQLGHDTSGMRGLLRIDPMAKKYARAMLFGKSIDPFLKLKLETR